MLKLVFLELATKAAAGLLLLFVPLTTIKVLGLPGPDTAFWPRLLGALLIALALATYMDVSVRLGHGLGLAGTVVINLTLGLVLAGLLYQKQGPQTRRGRLIMWLLAAGLLGLGLIEIAYV